MTDSCICVDTDDGEPVAILDQRVVRARKAYRCDECDGEIAVGEKYESIKLVCDGISRHKTCIPCLRIRESMFQCGWIFGEVWADIIESIRDTMTREEEAAEPDWRKYILPKSLWKYWRISDD